MNIGELKPPPTESETFRANRLRFIPDKPGCYVLTTFTGTVLYIGLTNSLHRRMKEHLDSPAKTSLTPSGRAIFFHWMVNNEPNKVERTWMNSYTLQEGQLPELNSIFSPTFT